MTKKNDPLHAGDCECQQCKDKWRARDDELLREMLHISPSKLVDGDDGPTILELYDTGAVLEAKNKNWVDDKLSQMIFAWQSGLFNEDHVVEVCKNIAPHLLCICLEYRHHGTIWGRKLDNAFGIVALNYIQPAPIPDEKYERFGTAPVRDCYIKLEKIDE